VTILFMALLFLVLVTPEIVVAIALLIWFVRLAARSGRVRRSRAQLRILRLWVGHSCSRRRWLRLSLCAARRTR
jgi:ABC-type spermidine/putrescine transport system permease subunit II